MWDALLVESELIELTVSGVAHGGVFVARHEGRVIFVADAIPGERILARITDSRKKSFWRAETVEVREASPHRVPHVWSVADVSRPPSDRAGGADFGHIALAHQRALKAEVLNDALSRFGKLESPNVEVNAPAGENEDGLRWRTRLSLHVDAEGRVGPFASRSHRVIVTDKHPLATAPIERAAAKLYAEGERIDLVQPADGRVRIVREGRRETVTEKVGDREFQLAAGGFWQVHRLAAQTLHDAVGDMIAPLVDPEGQHLDLYGGVGLFAATLAELGGQRVTSVESDAVATEYAGENLSEWLGARAETARVDRYLSGLVRNISARERERIARGVVVLDPPRAGAGRAVVEDLVALAPRAIAYVACDPVALSRDLATFADSGYHSTEIRAFDLFPHSHHMETIALLEKR